MQEKKKVSLQVENGFFKKQLATLKEDCLIRDPQLEDQK